MKRYLGHLHERISNSVFSLRKTIVFEADCSVGTDSLRLKELEFKKGEYSDLATLEGPENGYDRSDIIFCQSRLHCGDTLWIGLLRGRPVFSAWVMHGEMDLGWCNVLPLRPEIAYSYKLFTLESVRGQGICRAYYDFLKRRLPSCGYRRLVCRISPDNTASIYAHSRAGFQRVGMLWRLVLGPYSIYFADQSLRVWLQTALADEWLNPGGSLFTAWRVLGVF